MLLLRSTVKLQYRFGSKSRILQDYRWLEKNLGPLVPLEIVVRFRAARRTGANVLRTVAAGRADANSVFSSCPTWGPRCRELISLPATRPASGGVRDVTRTHDAASQRAEDWSSDWTRATSSPTANEGDPLWRISIRASALSDVDYGRFVETLRQRIDPIVASLDGVRVTYTGVIPLIYKAQRELLNDLVESFLLAFGVIALVMVVVLRDVRVRAAGDASERLSRSRRLRPHGLAQHLDRDRFDHDRQRGHGHRGGRHVPFADLVPPWTREERLALRGDAVRHSSLRRGHGSHHTHLLPVRCWFFR